MKNSTRNTIPIVVRPLLVSALSVVAGLAPWGIPMAQAQTRPPPIVAMFDIENQGAPLDGDSIARLSNLMFGLLVSGGLKLTPQDQVRQRVIELKRESYKECFDQSCQIELGKAVAAEKSMSTRVTRVGESCQVSTAVYDLRTEATDGGASAEGACTEAGVSQAIRKVVAQLTGGRAGTEGTPGRIEGGVALDRGEAIVNEPTDRMGFLFVRTNPAGATVYINGQEKGPSPQQLELPEGRYIVVAEMGRLYHPARQEVVLTTEGTRLVLDLVPAHGRVEVTSKPSGAEVWLDGVKEGITPLKLDRKPSGTYRMRVQLEEYVAAEQDLVVADGQTVKVHRDLDPDWGTLLVESEPPGAAIVLDDEATGLVTPQRFTRVRPGVHIIRMSLAGHGERAEKGNVVRGQEVRLTARLEPMLGTLVVTSAYGDGTPCEGELTLDGKPAGSTPWRGQVLAVEHRLAVACPGGRGTSAAQVRHNQRTESAVVVSGRAPVDEAAQAAARAAQIERERAAKAERERAAQARQQQAQAAPAEGGAGGASGSVTQVVTAPVPGDRRVRVPVTLSAAEGFLRYGGDTRRTHVGMGLDVGLRFRGASWLVPGLGLWWTVESPVAVTLRPGIQWYFGKFPMYVRTALAAMVTPERSVGFHAGLGGDVPLWKGGFLALEATTTVWSARVVPMEFRVGVGHAF